MLSPRFVPTRCLVVACIWACAADVAFLAHAQDEEGDEPVPRTRFEQFLAALRDRGYFDTAMRYLADMRTSPMVSESQRQVIHYEEAVTLLNMARVEREFVQKSRQLDQAKERFEQFIAAQPNHPLAPGASTQLGNILVERARMLLDQAARPSQAQQKDQLTEQARGLFKQAEEVFNQAEARFDSKLKEFPKLIDRKDPQYAAREQVRQDLIVARLFAAGVLFEASRAYPAGSPEATQLIQQAADKYEKVYERYRTRLAGLRARVKQGQCYQELGDTKRAVGYYNEVAAQPDESPPVRALKAMATRLILECYLHDSEKKYEAAVSLGGEWLAAAKGDDDRLPDGLGVRYLTARAMKLLADTLNKPADTNRKKQLLREARNHFKLVMGYPGPYKDEAKALFRQLAGLSDEEAAAEPETFAEARDLARDAIEAWQAAEASIKAAPSLGDEANIPQYQEQSRLQLERAQRYLALAYRLRDSKTSLEDVNGVRYLTCWLYYQMGRYYDAAVLGEFLAQRYPQSAGARHGAKIALAAYQVSYNMATQGARDFDRRRLRELAELITRRWPGEAEADEAWMVLVQIAVKERQLDQALQYLERIPASTANRAEAELRTGNAMYEEYLIASRKEGEERAPQAELDALAARARETLERGVQRLRDRLAPGDEVSRVLAAATLSLAQLYVGTGDAAKALEMLQTPSIGPLQLVTSGQPIAKEGNYAVETYKVALRAYVGMQQLAEAEQAMQALESLVTSSGDARAAESLTAIYIALGRELEGQLERLRKANDTAGLEAVSRGFELFLERIATRPGNTFNSLNWVAETFYRLGAGYDPGSQPVPEQARGYYDKAYTADQNLLAEANRTEGFASPEALVAVRLRMARCLRRLGRFGEATDLLADLLKQKPNLLDAQREACLTFEDRGVQDPRYFLVAIQGARKQKASDGRESNLIWGWNELSARLRGDPKFSQEYFDARYHLAWCRYQYAIKQKSSEQRIQSLARAEKELTAVYRLNPNLSGPDMIRRYDDLLRSIQKARGAPVSGLPRLAPASAAS